jgi:hypothetical protein
MDSLTLGSITLKPIPLVTINNEIQKDGAGQPIGLSININLKGEILPSGKGKIGSSQYVNALLSGGILAGIRQELNNLHKNMTPINLNFICPSMTFNNCYIKKYSVNENDNRWTTTIPYSIDLTSEIYDTSKNLYLVNSVSDNWTIEAIEEYWKTSAKGVGPQSPVYRITRSVEAVGKVYQNKSLVENAKEWVDKKSSSISGVISSSLTLFNHVRRVNVNNFEGSYKIDDTWMAVDGTIADNNYSIENFEIEINTDESKNVTANVKGSVQGLELFDKVQNTGYPDYTKPSFSQTNYPPSTGRFANALKTYIEIRNNMWSRATSLVNGGYLNPKPLSIVEGFDPAAGTITYSFSYDARPLNLISKAVSENINVSTNYGQKTLYASIFVLGRKLGPILQEINDNSIAYNTTTVTYECTLPSSGVNGLMFPTDVYNDLKSKISDFSPSNYTNITNSGFAWNMNENRLSMTIEYLHT